MLGDFVGGVLGFYLALAVEVSADVAAALNLPNNVHLVLHFPNETLIILQLLVKHFKGKLHVAFVDCRLFSFDLHSIAVVAGNRRYRRLIGLGLEYLADFYVLCWLILSLWLHLLRLRLGRFDILAINFYNSIIVLDRKVASTALPIFHTLHTDTPDLNNSIIFLVNFLIIFPRIPELLLTAWS